MEDYEYENTIKTTTNTISSGNKYAEFVKHYYEFLEENGKYSYVLKKYMDEIFELVFNNEP